MMSLERADGTRRVGWVSLIGLLLVPLVVAGGFLAATWSSDTRLDRVQAAVVNLDKPVRIDKQLVPLGRQLAGGLVNGDGSADAEGDQNFDWVLTDTGDADAGLETGRYAAVVTIPKDFSANATSYSDQSGDTAERATLDVQTSQVTGIVDPVVGQAITAAATKVLNNTLTESYLKNIYLGFNQTQKQFTKVADAADKLAAGSQGLAKGVNGTADGAAKLADGAQALSDGISQTATGTSKLADGAQGLMDGIDQTATGTSKLADGAQGLAKGLGQTADGTKKLTAGLQKLDAGGAELNRGVQQLSSGTTQYAAGVHTLATQTSKLPAGARALAAGAQRAAAGADQLADGSQKYAAGVAGLPRQLKALGHNPPAIPGPEIACPPQLQLTDSQCRAYKKAVAGASTQGFNSGYDAGLQTAVAAVTTEKNGQSIVSGASQLASGQRHAATGLQKLATGASSLADGLEALPAGIKKLDAGAAKLAGGATGLARGVKAYTGGVHASAVGAATLRTGVSKLAAGGDRLATGAAQLDAGVRQLSFGGKGLAKGAAELDAGVTQLVGGGQGLADGTAKLSTGTTKLSAGADQLADGTQQLADGLAKGADQIPTYDKQARENLSTVVAAPISTPAVHSAFSDVATTTLLTVLALWVGGLASFLVLRPVSARALSSMQPSWRLALGSLAPAAVIAAVQAVVLSVLLTALLDLSAGQTVRLLGLSLLAGLTFVALNHALAAWFGGVGRFVSVVLLVLAVAGAITSAVPAFFDAVTPMLPLTPARQGMRAVVTGAGGVGGHAGLLLAWLVLGLVAGLAAVARHRVARTQPVTV